MKFSEVLEQNVVIGYQLVLDNTLYFFGTKDLPRERLNSWFPHLEFSFVKQIHKDGFVEASEANPEADAHWTQKTSLAPVIVTADCLPILVSHPKFVAAVHAGWRGVENCITAKLISSLLERFGSKSDIQILVGPHILSSSFEVDLALAKKFQLQYESFGGSSHVFQKSLSNPDKGFVDLLLALKQQLVAIGIQPSQLNTLLFDTKTDQRFASYRRQPINPGRNISFVSRLKS